MPRRDEDEKAAGTGRRAYGTGRRATANDTPPVAGAQLVSVFGDFGGEYERRALVEMSLEDAIRLTGDNPEGMPSRVVNGVERDMEALRRRDPELADSALAASAMAMAFEIDNPYNSATGKSNCQARLADALRELRELAPAEAKKDALSKISDDLAARRAARAADQAGA